MFGWRVSLLLDSDEAFKAELKPGLQMACMGYNARITSGARGYSSIRLKVPYEHNSHRCLPPALYDRAINQLIKPEPRSLIRGTLDAAWVREEGYQVPPSAGVLGTRSGAISLLRTNNRS